MPALSEWLRGSTNTGERLPLGLVNQYRSHRLLPPFSEVPDSSGAVTLIPRGQVYRMGLEPEAVHGVPSRGIGDSIAKIARWTKLAKPGAWLVQRLWNLTDCGCDLRRRNYNERCPYPETWRRGVLRWTRWWI